MSGSPGSIIVYTVIHPRRRAEPSYIEPSTHGPYGIGSSLTAANTPVAPGCDKLAPQTTKPFAQVKLFLMGQPLIKVSPAGGWRLSVPRGGVLTDALCPLHIVVNYGLRPLACL